MKIAVPRERVPGERRVALVPETAGKFVKAGITVAIEHDAGREAGFLDAAYTAAGATIAADEAATVADADIVVRVNRPDRRRARPAQARRDRGRLPRAARRSALGRALRAARADRAQHGRDPAHDQSASDGRALLAGEHRRLQGRADRREHAAEIFPDAHDRRRHDQAGQSAHHRRRRRGLASDRDVPASGRGRHRVRHATGGQGTSAVARVRSSSRSTSAKAAKVRAATRASSRPKRSRSSGSA